MVMLSKPAESETGSHGSQNGPVYAVETLARRIEKVRASMDGLGLDSLLVSQPHNRRYLSGFTGEDQPPLDSAGFLLIGRDDICLITDGRYPIQASRELPRELNISVAVRTGKHMAAVAEQVARRKFKRLGF